MWENIDKRKIKESKRIKSIFEINKNAKYEKQKFSFNNSKDDKHQKGTLYLYSIKL